MTKIDFSRCTCGAKKKYSDQGCRACWYCSDPDCHNIGCDNTDMMSGYSPCGFDPDNLMGKTPKPLRITDNWVFRQTVSEKPEPAAGLTQEGQPYISHDIMQDDLVVVGTPPDNWYTRKSINGEINMSDCCSSKPKKCRIYRINKNNPLPSQANEGDAGYDVYASETVRFLLGETKLVPLGIIAEAPKGYHFALCIRSSIPYKRGFTIANSVGIIDSLYCGPKDEIKIMLRAPYSGTKYDHLEHVINEGDRIGQLILVKNNDIEWDEQESADFAEVSRGGFGSSGK